MAKRKRRSPRTPEQILIADNVKNATYLRRAKRLRGTHAFGDLFSAKQGADFRRRPESWSPQLKARITKYAKELGPIIAGESVTKRYFRPDHLKTAISVSAQRTALPGQKAALFPIDKGQALEVSFDRKHQITVKRGGIVETSLMFDMDALVRDPEKEIVRVVGSSDAQVFKIITGKSESSLGYTRSALTTTVRRWIERYRKDDPARNISKFDNWLYGIKAYPKLKVAKRLATRTVKHEKEVAERERSRLAALARTKRAMTKAQQRSIRATGRAGRTK